MDLQPHPCSVAPAEGPEKCGPRRPTRNGYSCNNADHRHGGASASHAGRGHRGSRPPTHRPRPETDPGGRARARGPRRAGPVADGAATATETPASPLRSAERIANSRRTGHRGPAGGECRQVTEAKERRDELVMPACQAPGLRWRCRPNGSCHSPNWANPWGRVHRRSAATPTNNTPAIIGARQSPAQTRVANITKQTTAPSAGTAIGSSNAP